MRCPPQWGCSAPPTTKMHMGNCDVLKFHVMEYICSIQFVVDYFFFDFILKVFRWVLLQYFLRNVTMLFFQPNLCPWKTTRKSDVERWLLAQKIYSCTTPSVFCFVFVSCAFTWNLWFSILLCMVNIHEKKFKLFFDARKP